MPQPETKFTSRTSLIVDAVLVIGFFLYMYSVLTSHVPSQNPKMVMLWGGLTASCFAAIFWLAVQMFRVVLRAQRAERASRRR